MEKKNSAKRKAQSPRGSVRHTLCALILVLSAICLYFLSVRLVAQIHYQRARNLFHKGYYTPAASHLKKACHYRPNDYLIWRELGRVYHKLGRSVPGAKQAFLFALKSKDYYLEAGRLNPIDAETVYGLARQEARLETLYEYLYPEKSNDPYEALPYFEKTIRLRPNGIRYHYALARYLYSQKKTDGLVPIIRTLSRIYPPSYHYMKKEPFWSPPVKEAARNGIEQAFEQGISKRQAHKAMSSLLADEREWAGALSHYRQALGCQPFSNSAGDYIHLGRLYLNNGALEEAEESFFKALDLSRSKEKDLERLYWVYKNEGSMEELYRFYQQVSRRFVLSSRMDILVARSLIDLKRYHKARQILVDLNQKEPTAEAYYWLARIAQTEKDWDGMELAIQKATVLEPVNGRYHFLFSRLLNQIKKLERAEKEAGLAIKHTANPSPWLFNNRAWIRWALKDHLGAAKDWESAIRLSPEKASFYARAGEAYRMLGYWPAAIDYYQKAMELDPENRHYKKRYREIKAEG
jgi:tetratricopeptide (TPR) repeat protein